MACCVGKVTTGKRVVVRALENVSLTVNHGDQLGIIGHNGAGKSTMLRVFAGIYEPSQGTISIDGRVSPLFSTSPGLDPGRYRIREYRDLRTSAWHEP